MMTYDSELAHEPVNGNNDDAEAREYAAEAADDAAYDAETEAQMTADLQYTEYDLTERVAKARELVHTALMAAEAGNGLGLLRIDSLLTQALAELGCKRCGKPIPLEHMQSYSICRSRGECASYCEGH